MNQTRLFCYLILMAQCADPLKAHINIYSLQKTTQPRIEFCIKLMWELTLEK